VLSRPRYYPNREVTTMCCQPPPPDRSTGGPALTGTTGKVVLALSFILLVRVVVLATWARSGG